MKLRAELGRAKEERDILKKGRNVHRQRPRVIQGRHSIITPKKLDREFTVNRPDKAGASDISYIRTWQ